MSCRRAGEPETTTDDQKLAAVYETLKYLLYKADPQEHFKTTSTGDYEQKCLNLATAFGDSANAMKSTGPRPQYR